VCGFVVGLSGDGKTRLVCMYVCMCVCVRAREKECEGGTERERLKIVCMCGYVVRPGGEGKKCLV